MPVTTDAAVANGSPEYTRRRLIQNAALVAVAGASLTAPSTAHASAPPSEEILNAYSEWLYLERRALMMLMYPEHPEVHNVVPQGKAVSSSYSDMWRRLKAGGNMPAGGTPISRAPLILSAAGIDLSSVLAEADQA